MGGACRMQGMCTKLWSEGLKGRDLLKDQYVDGRIMDL
jgi:hypothetical protein